MIDFDPAVQPVLEVINAMLWPLIAVIGSIGTIYCVFLGVKYSKADTPQDREQAKKHLIGAIVGFLIIFVLIVTLKIIIPILENWVESRA